MLNSKPHERRELIEEAAGLGRFKRRRHRAELKLARVAVQVERARDLEDEVKKRLRPLALQATAAERAEKLGLEIARLQAAIATLDLARLAERRGEADARRPRRRPSVACSMSGSPRSSPSASWPRRSSPTRPAPASRRRRRSTGCGAAASASSCAVSRPPSLTASLRTELEAARTHDPSASVELEAVARDAAATAQLAAAERARLQVEAEERWARVAAVERGAQAVLAAELDEVLARRTQTESLLTGGGRDALLALRGAVQRLGVRHESAERLLSELQRDLESARRAPAGRHRPSSAAPPTTPTAPRALPRATTKISTRASAWRVSG